MPEYQGINVTFDMLPVQAKALIDAGISPGDFGIRLKSGGTITLDGTNMVLAPINESQKSFGFLALDKLELKNGAKIVTNGNTLVIFANTISSEDGQIVAFEPANTKASGGAAVMGEGGSGNPGHTGLSGGLVSIHVLENLMGILHVNLSGQAGGDGSAGNKGATGTQGSKGNDAQDGPGGYLTPGWCKQGGSGGGQGGKGYAGGAGGPGGAAGDGGILELYNVGDSPLPSPNYTFVSVGGPAGVNGHGGPGGDGGSGGPGGNGSTWCGGGSGGPTGPQGDPGLTLTEPPRSGAPGQLIAKNLDIALFIRSATAPSTPALAQRLSDNRSLLT